METFGAACPEISLGTGRSGAPGGASEWGAVCLIGHSLPVVLVTAQAPVVLTQVVITHCGQQFPVHSCAWPLSFLPSIGTAALSPEGVPEGPQMLSWGVQGI